MNLTVRRLQAGDRAMMRSLLTTEVGGTSPYDEIVADWGRAPSLTAQELAAYAQAEDVVVAGGFDASGVLRGFNVFRRDLALAAIIGGRVPDAWESTYTVTDKRLGAADRLSVFGWMLLWGARRVDPNTYIYGWVVAGRRLDGFLSRYFQSRPAEHLGVACTLYYGPASDVLAVADRVTA